MDFGSAISAIFSIESIVLMIVIYLLTAIVRKLMTQAFGPLVAKVMPDKYEPWFIMIWTKWILPALPVVIGVLFGFFVAMYPYPTVFAASVSGRICFCIVAGAASSYAYRGFKGVLQKIIGDKAKEIEDKIES